MRKKIFFAAAGLVMLILILNGCVYHKADQLYPSTSGCDTTHVRFSAEIKNILDANCKSCHDGENSVSGIDLYNHSIIAGFALDGLFTHGTLLSSVKQEGGAPAMPPTGVQLQECDINKIAAWIHAGAPDN